MPYQIYDIYCNPVGNLLELHSHCFNAKTMKSIKIIANNINIFITHKYNTILSRKDSRTVY